MLTINTDLKDKGYIPLLPRTLYAVASNRKLGYIEECTRVSTLLEGVFYMPKEEYERIKNEYQLPPQDSSTSTPAVVELAPAIAKNQNLLFEENLKKFLDETQECAKEEWREARAAYLEEIRRQKTAGCSTCQLNAIKQKYRNLLKNL